jgi:pre-mRNA-processing factor 39
MAFALDIRATRATLPSNMATTTGSVETAAAPSAPPPMERFNKAVAENPMDFNSWVQLLALVETEPNVKRATVEATFDKFLLEFPLCFGYWNKVRRPAQA